MDLSTNQKGNIGEAKAIAHCITLGYEVFQAFGTACSFDLVIHKDGELSRVSVKSTSKKEKGGKSWRVHLTQETRGKKRLFDSSKVDILAVYLSEEDRVVLLPAWKISSQYTTSIKIGQ